MSDSYIQAVEKNIDAAGERTDEITRLREENARLREETDGGKADDCKSCGCQYESWKANYQRLTIQNDALREENARLRNCIRFFASVIKSGEEWSETCQQKYAAAIQEGEKG